MKVFILLLWALPAMALTPYTADIDTSVTNLGASYTTSYPQLALTGLSGVQHFAIIIQSVKPVCCYTVSASSSVAPSAGDGHELCVPATYSYAWDFINARTNVFCRSGSTTITSGVISVQAW